MARIKGKDIYLKDDDQIYFGDNQEAALWFLDSELRLDHTISGTLATQGYHLVRKDQVPDYFLDLTDTPTSYSGYGGAYVLVKSDETGLEFVEPTSASGIEYVRFTAGSFLLGATATKPSTKYVGPVAGLAFDDTKDEVVYGSFSIPNEAKANSNIILKIYAMNDDAQTAIRTCKWCIDYHTYDEDDTYASKTTTTMCQSSTLSNNAPAGEVFITQISLNYSDANNPLSKAFLSFKLYRDANDAADTLVGDAILTTATFKVVVLGV